MSKKQATSINIDQSLWQNAKIAAIQRGITITQLLEIALRKELTDNTNGNNDNEIKNENYSPNYNSDNRAISLSNKIHKETSIKKGNIESNNSKLRSGSFSINKPTNQRKQPSLDSTNALAGLASTIPLSLAGLSSTIPLSLGSTTSRIGSLAESLSQSLIQPQMKKTIVNNNITNKEKIIQEIKSIKDQMFSALSGSTMSTKLTKKLEL